MSSQNSDDMDDVSSPRLRDDAGALSTPFDVRHRTLSATPMGQFMQSQAQLFANISCCLDVAKCCEQVMRRN